MKSVEERIELDREEIYKCYEVTYDGINWECVNKVFVWPSHFSRSFLPVLYPKFMQEYPNAKAWRTVYRFVDGTPISTIESLSTIWNEDVAEVEF